MGFLAQLALWLVGDLVGGMVADVLSRPAAWFFRPLTTRLREPTGGRVLAVICLICAGWFWLAWYLAAHARGDLGIAAAWLSFVCAPALALISFGVWFHRNGLPGRRPRGSAY